MCLSDRIGTTHCPSTRRSTGRHRTRRPGCRRGARRVCLDRKIGDRHLNGLAGQFAQDKHTTRSLTGGDQGGGVHGSVHVSRETRQRSHREWRASHRQTLTRLTCSAAKIHMLELFRAVLGVARNEPALPLAHLVQLAVAGQVLQVQVAPVCGWARDELANRLWDACLQVPE
ncbi:hypothetical protein BCR44DRAFT_33607 [Catenaria anguillulae PL171]|uniref:Uncharacterized protein n=1 Tax=Catenaria anguillulae PL171 TaxID=765915 RepID=A0A1Y2HJK5_9FUNG|nr:hypothetical protein BCR44DRAFT_33607 [Catenaria anguillulae PL171]